MHSPNYSALGFEFESTIAGLLNVKPVLPVYTHQNVDADAAFSVAAWAYLTERKVRDLDLHFVSSEADIPKGVVALDVKSGIKGLDSCCFNKLVSFFGEDNYTIKTLGKYLTKIDTRGSYDEGLPPGVFYLLPAHILGGLKMTGKSDLEICEWAEGVLLALIAQGTRTQKSYNSELPANAVKLAQGKVVILPQRSPQYMSSVAFRKGAIAVVYQDGFNTGILKKEGSSLNLKQLHQKLPDGFYLDHRGFLLAWGSKKFPKTEPSPVTPQDLGLMVAKELGFSGRYL